MKQTWKDIRFLAALSKQICPYYCVSKFLDETLRILSACVYIFLPKRIIDAIVSGQSWERVLGRVGILLACAVAVKIADLVTRAYRNAAINQAGTDTLKHYGSLYMDMDYERFETAEVRDLLETVMGKVRGETAVNFVVGAASACFQVILYSAVIVALSPVLLVVIVGTMALRLFVSYRKNGIESDTIPGFKKNSRRYNYIDSVMTGFRFAKEMRTNQADSLMEEKYRENIRERHVLNTAYNRRLFLANGLELCADAVELFALYGYGGYKTLCGEITLGSFTMYAALTASFTQAVSQLMECIMQFKLTLSFVGEYHVLAGMMQGEGVKRGREDVDIPEPPYTFEFRGVNFCYPHTERMVLEDVNLRIAPGEKVAVVGRNGAGKTTLIKLLCGIYVPTAGEILVNGMNIQSIDKAKYAELIASVFQDYALFSFDVKDNIVLDKEENLDLLREAITRAGLEGRMEQLPLKTGTPVGREFSDEGVDFSGGERQKIALARACYKDSALIILDEPTASMDPLAELKLYEDFGRLIRGKSAIFISHRLASTKFCDRVVVFEDGRIVESGTHEELMDVKGKYYEMFNLQTELYA